MEIYSKINKKNGLYAHKEPFKSTYLIKRFPYVFLKTC